MADRRSRPRAAVASAAAASVLHGASAPPGGMRPSSARTGIGCSAVISPPSSSPATGSSAESPTNHTVVDTRSACAPVMRVCRSAAAMEVIDALEQARCQHGLPTTIRVDQEPFTSKELDLWPYANGRSTSVAQGSRPTTRYFESFNATFDWNAWADSGSWIWTTHAKRLKNAEPSTMRAHSAIGDRTPLSLIQQARQHAEASNRPEVLS